MTLHLDTQTDGNVSVAWLRAFDAVQSSAGHEAYGLVIEIKSGDGRLVESAQIRGALDNALSKIAEGHAGRASRPTLVQTVASTIFPASMWNSAKPRDTFFKRYQKVSLVIQRDPRNKDGTYFSRFLERGQLEHVLSTRLERQNHRRSAYQLVVFDPSRDHGHWRQKGFPCLHQVSFVPEPEAGTLGVVGYYPTQTMFEKAYGNYLGLWNLGCFVAHEWGLRMESLTCFAVVAKGSNGKHNAIAAELHQSMKSLR